jgi:hypothetical protein
VKKKTSSTLSKKTSSSHAKTRSFSPEHYIKWDGMSERSLLISSLLVLEIFSAKICYSCFHTCDLVLN